MTDRIQTPAHYRFATVEVARNEGGDGDVAANDGTVTLRMSFASEAPVERMGFLSDDWLEVLDHGSGSVRLDWLNSGRAPFLIDHDNSVGSRVGTVSSAWIGDDRVARAEVMVNGQSPVASQLRQEIAAGMVPNISVGYRLHKVVREEAETGPDTFRAMDWEPFEISSVAVPADVSVGIGRGHGSAETDMTHTEVLRRDGGAGNNGESEMPEKVTTAPAPAAQPAVPAENATRAEPKVDVEALRRGELERIQRIEELGQRLGEPEFAREHIQKGTSAEQFGLLLLERQEPAPVEAPPASELGLSERETAKEYSLLRAIQAQLLGTWGAAGFEEECHREIEGRLGKVARDGGFFVPYEVTQHMSRAVYFRDQFMANHGRERGLEMFIRTMTTGTATGGAELVGTEHRPDLFIEYLRENSAVIGFGARVLNGLVQSQSIPRQDGTTTWAWLAEDADSTPANIATGTLALAPNTIAGSVAYSRKLLIQSQPSVEAMIRADMMVGLPIAVDLAALNGSGTGAEPLGVRNTTGIGTVTIADVGGVPTWAEWVAFESAVNAGDALAGQLAYITTASLIGAAKTTPRDAGSGIFCMTDNGQINGYPVRKRDAAGANSITYGDWGQVIVAFWGNMEIQVDRATKAASGGTVLRAFHEADIGVRHPVAFAKEA